MKPVYVFNVQTGAVIPSARTLPLITTMCWPFETILTSKVYSTPDECIRECIHFVNSQVSQIQNNHMTVIESNPFIAGTASDFNDEQMQSAKILWADDEMFKVHVADPETQTRADFPLTCSIFKVFVATGFEVDGNSTKH